ncbi:SpoIID/LytB domain-containing protein [Halanaerobium sp. Z-7514]|uniref:SpoIID/LytB domain-containing protein n=1 Tax=Halanaerobium polyolivorans TaxID=2886943 RepID=A0AAW4WW40_9FIRM|nr:SpoIID/LytB domain-containing protein [Halanaerobium polyolivorans]MCC3144830.1 SpoIID/LytB domain-containing protein [Halanaerobium polyolivorans]RQD76545.1 MAG: SpoIID/LytB domain-containing protein [Halanaerobium sp. MSAO_Bac5]
MKKIFRLIIITTFLTGLLIPGFNHFLNQQPGDNITFSQENIERRIAQYSAEAVEAFYAANYQTAVNYYEEILELDPFNLESRRNLAVIYNDKNDLLSENRELLKTAILSNRAADIIELAVSFYKLNNAQAANYLLQNMIEAEDIISKRDQYQKYYYLIKSQLELDKLAEAEGFLKQLEGLNLNRAQVKLLRAELNQKLGNYYQAYEDLNNSYQADRTQNYLFREMALMLEKAGEDVKAYDHWQRSLSFGLYIDEANQRIDYYQEHYPYLRPDDEEEKREEINPFILEANWQDIEELETETEVELLRIGLSSGNRTLLFQYSDPFSIIYQGKILFNGEARKNYLLEIDDNSLTISDGEQKVQFGRLENEYQLYSEADNSSFYVYNVEYGQGYFWQGRADRQYRGDMIIKGAENSFTLINELDLTAYLLSVVPSEIYSSWPEESLKAQAVAARSYTLSNLGRHSGEGYDLCSTVHCAAYNGVGNENPRTSNAVLATRGESVYYGDRIIEAVFSSNSGGFTERSDEIWVADLPYLRGANQMKGENFDFPLPPAELKEWLKNDPPSYSRDFNSSSYRWQVKVPVSVIEDRTELGKIKNIEVLKRATGGTITSLRIVGEDASREFNSSQIRRVLGGLRSSRFKFNSIMDSNGYLKELNIYGSGWGHNLGMDQSAAAGMAAEGWNYSQIISHFYPGVEIREYNNNN